MKATPYTKPYKKIKDVDQFFSYDDKTKEMRFISNSLTIIIPQRYEVYQLLEISDTIKTLAIFDMIIDDIYQAGLMMLTTIEIEADDVNKIMIGDIPYIAITVSNGSRFICNTERIADSNIVYAIWMEFITRGKLIYNINYDTLSTLFDQAKTMCDSNINVDHAIFEVIYSHLCRDFENLSIQYRHTDRSNDFKLIPLRNVGYATISTTSKIMGSYFRESLNSSLIQTNLTKSPVEDLLRN